MKTILSIEESARLIELGVDAKLASQELIENICQQEYNEPRPKVFTLTDILSILPKEIGFYCLNMSFYMDEWCVYYEKIEALNKYIILQTYTSSELIDALNQLLIWCLTEKKINLNTEKK